MKLIRPVLSLLPMLLLALSTSANAADGMIKIKSPHNTTTTTEKLVAALNAKGMTVFNQIDHAAAAKKAGMELLPTTLVVFGNPKVGTHLMNCAQSAGIDMPMKALISEDAQGDTWYSYTDPAYTAKRHGAEDCKIVGKMTKAMGAFAKVATSP